MAGKNQVKSDLPMTQWSRMAPPIIVLSVVVGFAALSWYAYRAGTQSIKNGNLLVVEADKTPVKEKPVNAGGMQFPDQDKTIFDTFSSNPRALPKVERVLPVPEEPVTASADTSGTVGWVNDKFHKTAVSTPQDKAAGPGQPVVAVIPPSSAPQMKKAMASAPLVPQQFSAVDTASVQSGDQTELYVAKPAVKAEEPKVLPVAVKPPPAALYKPQVHSPASLKKNSNGAFKVQLGAYRSQAEALAAWNSMQKKHGHVLSGLQPTIVKADLGSKGTYYRLRVGGFASSAEAKALCGKLSAAGQACLVPTGK